MTDLRPNGTTTILDVDQLAAAGARVLDLYVPTRELLTLLRDAAPFASPDADNLDLHVVQIQWDADDDRLNVFAADGYRTAWSSWGPDDIPEPVRGEQDMLGTDFGPTGPDAGTTAITIDVGDIKDILNTFKVDKKDGRVPLRITLRPEGMTIYRSPDSGYSEHTLRLKSTQARFPDVRGMLANWAAKVATTQGALTVSYTPTLLKDFTGVRPGSVLELTFASEKITLVRVGRYFRGSICPATPEAL